MADILGKDLENWEDSLATRQPFNLTESDVTGPQFMTGSDFMRSAKINPEWKMPVAIPAQATRDTYKVAQSLISAGTVLSDVIANYLPNLGNLGAQYAIELTGEKEREETTADKLLKGTEIGGLYNDVARVLGMGMIGTDAVINRKEYAEKAKTYDDVVELLNNRDYPLTKYAHRVLADTTNDVETRRIVRELYNQAQGIDSSKWYNEAGSIIGAMIPTMVVARGAGGTARAFGASRLGAINTAQNVAKAFIGGQMAGEYAEETAREYLERTGDKTFSNFTASDAHGLSAAAYGAIGAQIEFLGGVEPVMAGALSKVGLRSGLLKAGVKIGVGESAEELLQGLTEILMRKMDGTTDKTWKEGFEEAINGAVWGLFIGGTMGTTAFYANRRNLVKGIKTALPNISDTQAQMVADVMIDNVAETSSQDPTLRANLRQKVVALYRDIDLDNKEDRIDAMTDLEYSLIAMDSADRGIELAEHELFQGEVNELGWFRAGIPETEREQIKSINDNIVELRTQLEELNKTKEKDWEKIEEIENKLAQASQYVLEKVSDLATEFEKLERKYVAKEKKKAGIPTDTVETTDKKYTDAEILGMFAKAKNDGSIKLDNWENVRWSSLLSAGDTYQKGKRNKPATEADKAKFARKMLDKYTPGWNTVETTQKKPMFQPEQFDLADENARLDDIYPAYEGDTIEVDGKERTVYNSNGDRIAKSKEALTNFWRWFGDSKVVDEQGRPLVVYHGSPNDFNEFNIEQAQKESLIESGVFYFTPNMEYARQYSRYKYTGKEPRAFYLNIQNIQKYDSEDYTKYPIAEKGAGFAQLRLQDVAKLQKQGFDGAIYEPSKERKQQFPNANVEIAVFDSTQIKSVDNRGTYSSDTGNIYWQNRVSGAAPKTYRGAYIPQFRFILRANKMDASTLSHELAHDWMEANFARYRSDKQGKDFMKAWGALEKALGIPENATSVPQKASETFARAYEAWIVQNEDWAKLIAVEDKDKDAVEKLMKDYQEDLRDIYNDISNPYFKQTWGKLGELKPELKAWFDRVVNITDLDVMVERGEMTEEQAANEKLNRAINTVIETTEDEETAQTLKEVRTLNDTQRYEVEGGSPNSIQRRLSNLAREIDENNMALKGDKYDTRRDMMAVAEAADNFVKTRLDDALAIINGEMAETEGLYKEDLYTALERLAVENGDLGLIDELKNSEVANRLAKELGQRVAGFRNFKQSTDIDVMSALKSLDMKFNKALDNKKAKQQYDAAIKMLDESIKQQDKVADKELDNFLKDLECK